MRRVATADEGSTNATKSAWTFDDAVRTAGRWFIVGSAAVGFALGWFVGMSSTPVVGALLPLLLAGIGGGSGVLIARTPLDGGTAVWRIRCVGLATLAFAVLSVGGALVGSSIRHGYLRVPGWSAAGAAGDVMPPLDLGQLPIADQVRLLVIRGQLKLIGVAGPDRDAVLDTAVKHCKVVAARKTGGEIGRARLQAELQRLSQWASSAAESGEVDGEEAEFLVHFARRLAAAAVIFEESVQTDDPEAVRLALRAYATEEVDTALMELGYTDSDAVAGLLLEDAEARRALAILNGHSSNYVSEPQSDLEDVVSALERHIQLLSQTGAAILQAAPTAGPRRDIASTDQPAEIGTVDG